MHIVDDPVETIHVYMVKEEEKQAPLLLPLFAALLCLAVITSVAIYSGSHPAYEHETLTVPAHFLPLKVFRAEAPIIPTGIKTYPATYAIGTLTLTNGSVLSETLPQGVIFNGVNGVEVQTTESVFIPSGSASGYGVATVPARAVVAGTDGNIQTLAINAVYGTALYVRNTSSFSGGNDAYMTRFVTDQDRLEGVRRARNLLAEQKAQILAYLAKPCSESQFLLTSIKTTITWHCQFVTYKVPSYMRVMAAHLVGKSFLVDVVFVARPERTWAK